jgi:CheY-like chemotaxis protein
MDTQSHSSIQSYEDMRRAHAEKRVLIADDNMYTRLLVRKGLEALYKTAEVADGKDVLAAYAKYAPNVLFLDIHMPNMDVKDIMREISAVDPNAYVILLSADSASSVVLMNDFGAKAFLSKPFTKDNLIEQVQKCPNMAAAHA